MADPDPRRDETLPPGTSGDGQADYPTYHDRPGDRPLSATERRSRGRTPWMPFLIGVLLFGVVIVIYMLMGVFNSAQMSDEASTAGDPASPAATAPAEPATNDAGTAGEAAEPGLDADVEEQTQTGPGQVEPTPGGIDVPGGETTEPVPPAGTTP